MNPLPPPPAVESQPGRTTLYHWTSEDWRAEEIPRGVHLCDRYDQHRRGRDDVLLLVELPLDAVVDVRLDPIQTPGCRDYVIPATVVNAKGTVRRAYP